jgi:hypothetical protein
MSEMRAEDRGCQDIKKWQGKVVTTNVADLDGDDIPDWKDFDIKRADGQPITEPLPFIRKYSPNPACLCVSARRQVFR